MKRKGMKRIERKRKGKKCRPRLWERRKIKKCKVKES